MITILQNLLCTSLPIIAHSGCIDSTSSTTDVIIEPIPASSGLSGEHNNCEYYANTSL